MLMLAAAGGVALAGLTTARAAPQAANRGDAAIRQLVGERQTKIEQELAKLIQSRGDAGATAPGPAAYLELRIDGRVAARWLWGQVERAAPASELAAVAYLRARDLDKVVAGLDALAARQGNTLPSRAAGEGMLKLRQATYKLKNAGDVGELDDLLTPLRGPLLDATGLAAGSGVTMRPDPAASRAGAAGGDASPAGTDASGPPGPATAATLAARITRLSIGVPLRRQLLALANNARLAEADDPAEHQTLLAALRSSVDLAEGLAANNAVAAADRLKLEQDLADALALFGDGRTRDAGTGRLAKLDAYRGFVREVDGLNLPPNLAESLKPVLLYARAHPDLSADLLKAVRQFAEVEQAGAAAVDFQPFAEVQNRTFEALRQQQTDGRALFLADASKLGAGGLFGSTPQGLVQSAAELATRQRVLNAIQYTKQTTDLLLRYKPRPTGGVEKRLTQALVQAAPDQPAPEREAGDRVLLQLDALRESAVRTMRVTQQKIDPGVAERYAGNRASDLASRAERTIAAAAAQAAGDGELKLDEPLAALQLIRQAAAELGFASQIEAARAPADALTRWADWDVGAEAVDALFAGYRSELAAVVAALADGKPVDPARLDKLAEAYHPVLRQIESAQAYCDAVAKLPDGIAGDISRLTTPSLGAPFVDERRVSFAIDMLLVARRAGDRKSAARWMAIIHGDSSMNLPPGDGPMPIE